MGFLFLQIQLIEQVDNNYDSNISIHPDISTYGDNLGIINFEISNFNKYFIFDLFKGNLETTITCFIFHVSNKSNQFPSQPTGGYNYYYFSFFSFGGGGGEGIKLLPLQKGIKVCV